MNFEAWLLNVGKSERSAKSYSGAVSGVISNWAIDAGITNCALTDLRTVKEYIKVVDEIKSIPIFQARNAKGNGMYSSALNAYRDYLADISAEDIQDDIAELFDDQSLGKTEKAMLINARVGQGKFRQQLIDEWQGCALTGFNDPRFLVASHIKPWRNSDNQERLDPYNGLLLLPNYDKVFDLGYITFAADGDIMVSTELENIDLLGVRHNMAVRLDHRHHGYMSYHREMVFEKANKFD